MTGIASPAEIGFDLKRNRVFVAVFLEDRVIIRDLPASTG